MDMITSILIVIIVLDVMAIIFMAFTLSNLSLQVSILENRIELQGQWNAHAGRQLDGLLEIVKLHEKRIKEVELDHRNC